MQAALLIRYVRWHYGDAFFDITKGWGNMLWFVARYFSLPLLAKTYLSPWRRIQWSYGKGFSPGTFLFTLSSNLLSRLIGALLRTFLIASGLFWELVLLITGFLVAVLWLVSPALIGASFFYGISLLF